MDFRARFARATPWLRDLRGHFWQFWHDVAIEQELEWLRSLSRRRIGDPLR
jgi:hypothetical protein